MQAKRDEEEARLAEVEGLVDLLQREPGAFKSPPLSPEDGNTEFVMASVIIGIDVSLKVTFTLGLLLRKANFNDTSITENSILRQI